MNDEAQKASENQIKRCFGIPAIFQTEGKRIQQPTLEKIREAIPYEDEDDYLTLLGGPWVDKN